MSKVENSPRCPPRLPEVAITAQDSSSATTEINLSVEDEIHQLRERKRQLEAENAIFREGFTRIYNALSRAYSTKGAAEKKTTERYAQTVEKLETVEDRTGYLATMAENMIEGLATPPAPPLLEPTGPDPLRYDVKTLNQKRAEALAAHVQTTGKNSIKSTEARAVLETIEGRALDRKVVHRALDAAQSLLRASKDMVGGIARLVIPGSPSWSLRRTLDVSDGRHDSGGGGGMPRRRRSQPLGSG
jgi:hypothetical protein